MEEEWVQRKGRELQLPEEEVRWRKGTEERADLVAGKKKEAATVENMGVEKSSDPMRYPWIRGRGRPIEQRWLGDGTPARRWCPVHSQRGIRPPQQR